jgi:hypothetical protein
MLGRQAAMSALSSNLGLMVSPSHPGFLKVLWAQAPKRVLLEKKVLIQQTWMGLSCISNQLCGGVGATGSQSTP